MTDIASPPLPEMDPTLCPRCGVELDGPWVRFCHRGGHYAEAELRAEPTAWAKLPARSEDDIQAGIVRVMEFGGFHVWTTSQKRPSKVALGLPDFLFAGHEVTGCVEVKRSAKEDLRPAQQEFAAVWNGNGGTCLRWNDESDAVEFVRRAKGDA